MFVQGLAIQYDREDICEHSEGAENEQKSHLCTIRVGVHSLPSPTTQKKKEINIGSE